MKRVTFYYVRHGRTEYNRDGIIQGGGVDSPLAEDGLDAVRATGHALSVVPLTRCFSSPQRRAVDTARIVLGGRDVPIETVDGLREVSFGTLDGRRARGADAARFAVAFARQDYHPYGGEDAADVRGRVRGAFERMYGDCEDGDQALVAGHGSYLRYVLHEFLPGSPLARAFRSRTIVTHNASVAVIEARDGRFELRALPMDAAEFEGYYRERHPMVARARRDGASKEHA